ncbi:MAG: hypothetical protein HFI92_13485 [Lachnospiraceae bacterium]|nr:hypothetical protein [Lachnospiraceae bacterium]
MKIMSAKKQFTDNHPRFAAFLSAVFGKGIEEGTIIELKVTKPGQEAMVTNIKVQQSDLELLQELKEMMR